MNLATAILYMILYFIDGARDSVFDFVVIIVVVLIDSAIVYLITKGLCCSGYVYSDL